MAVDREHLTQEEAVEAARSLARVGGVYKWIANAVEYYNTPSKEDYEKSKESN